MIIASGSPSKGWRNFPCAPYSRARDDEGYSKKFQVTAEPASTTGTTAKGPFPTLYFSMINHFITN